MGNFSQTNKKMKRLITIWLFLAAAFSTQSQHLNVMTFNIRMNTPNDSLNAWPYRKDLAASQILFHRVHSVGLQEALPEQMKDLTERLKGYKHVGVGRTDGKNKGEHSAIFYDTSRLEVRNSGTFWLSETPEKAGSKGWDASLPRIVTWAEFFDKASGKTFWHFNTHFDHKGEVARRESSKLLMAKVKEMAGDTPAIITGDFNATPNEEPIRLLLTADDSLRFTDSKEVSLRPHYGPIGTFNGFTNKETTNEPIDFIFIRNNVKVLQHASLSQTWGGRYSSDHFPVYAEIEL